MENMIKKIEKENIYLKEKNMESFEKLSQEEKLNLLYEILNEIMCKLPKLLKK